MLMIVVVIRGYTGRSGGVVDRGRDERGRGRRVRPHSI